jgi:hypothetical protein
MINIKEKIKNNKFHISLNEFLQLLLISIYGTIISVSIVYISVKFLFQFDLFNYLFSNIPAYPFKIIVISLIAIIWFGYLIFSYTIQNKRKEREKF